MKTISTVHLHLNIFILNINILKPMLHAASASGRLLLTWMLDGIYCKFFQSAETKRGLNDKSNLKR